jgi:hypothetical protein
MLGNVNYAIISSQINDLHGAIKNETKMEEYMLDTNANPKIILGKVQIQMFGLSISPQGPYASRSYENKGIGGAILQGVPPNVRNDLGVAQQIRKKIEIDLDYFKNKMKE